MTLDKSWLVTLIPFLMAMGFSLFTLATGHVVTDSEADIVEKCWEFFGVAGGIGAAKAGHKMYVQSQKKTG